MAREKDGFERPLQQLEQALAADVVGREREWAEGVGKALALLEQALHRHSADADAGLYEEVDLTRPAFARQVGELCQEHADFLERTRALRKEVEGVVQAFTAPAQQPDLPRPTAAGGIADFGTIRQHGEQLVESLRKHRQEEMDLVL